MLKWPMSAWPPFWAHCVVECRVEFFQDQAGYEKFFPCTVTGLYDPSFVHWKCVINELQLILRFSGFYALCSRVQLLYCTKDFYIVQWELAVHNGCKDS